MKPYVWIILFTSLLTFSSQGIAQDKPQPLSYWDFNTGKGNILYDRAGKNNGKIFNAEWIKNGEGYALRFNGVDAYVDCGPTPSLNLPKNITLMGWVKPLPGNRGEVGIMGKHYSNSYAITWYSGGFWAYIGGGGGNNLKHVLPNNKWSHIALTFDGDKMEIFFNGVKCGSRKSKVASLSEFPNFRFGAVVLKNSIPKRDFFVGEIDEVKVFGKALNAEEVSKEYLQKAKEMNPGLESNPEKPRAELFFYNKPSRMVASINMIYTHNTNGKVVAVLTQNGKDIQEKTFGKTDRRGEAELELDLASLPEGKYTLNINLLLNGKVELIRKFDFKYPFEVLKLPSPGKELAEKPIQSVVSSPEYDLKVSSNGGMELSFQGETFEIGSIFSVPEGGFNAFGKDKSNKNWKVKVTKNSSSYIIDARNDYYRIIRTIRQEKSRILVNDEINNTSGKLLGIIINNYIPNNNPDHQYALESNPTVWLSNGKNSLGLVALDDVYQCHMSSRNYRGKIEMRDEHLGIEAGKSYKMQWAIYPTPTVNYLDFINLVRKDELEPLTIKGSFSFLNRNGTATENDIKFKNIRYGSVGCLSNALDNGVVDLEGFEFLRYPKESARLKEQMRTIKEKYGFKPMFHVAHTIYATNTPKTLFPVSRALNFNGKQLIFGPDSNSYYKNYWPKSWFDAGWRWWLYYPTMDNSFGKFGLKAIDYMLDYIGAEGMWADGFFEGYMRTQYPPYLPCAFDGNSVIIDPVKHTVKQKAAHITLLSSTFLRTVIRKIAKKGMLISNGGIGPRSFWGEQWIASAESEGGDARHISTLYFARAFATLGSTKFIKNSRDVYRDILNKLKLGSAYFFYTDHGLLDYETLIMDMYPIKVKQFRKGTLFGENRIITMNSGSYSWPGCRNLHLVRCFDARGRRTSNLSFSTIDNTETKTKLKFNGKDESAAIIQIPVEAVSTAPVNLVVRKYDVTGIEFEMNGWGLVYLKINNDEFKLLKDDACIVNNVRQKLIDNKLKIELNGWKKVIISREK
jgi:hypothetical protein